MKTSIIVIAAAAGVTFALPALAEDKAVTEVESKTKVEQDASGNYNKKVTTSQKSTDSAGTTTKADTTVKIDVDADGDSERVVEQTKSTDPKGLFNKTTEATTDKVERKDGKFSTKHKKKVNGKVVENTETKEDVTQ